jgi:DNA-binding CsgD family transcriptional regulator
MRQMRDSFDMYPEQVVNLSDQREGHGILLFTESLVVLFIDSRARKLCQEIRRVEEQNGAALLPMSLVKLCWEIKNVLPLRNHPKDWEEFAIKRVIRGVEQQIYVCGIGLPAMFGAEAGILLTLDYIGDRAGPGLNKRMEQFKLSHRETMVIQDLLKGWTNKEIAMELHITEQTVKEHVKHIMEKTNTTTRTGILSTLSGID